MLLFYVIPCLTKLFCLQKNWIFFFMYFLKPKYLAYPIYDSIVELWWYLILIATSQDKFWPYAFGLIYRPGAFATGVRAWRWSCLPEKWKYYRVLLNCLPTCMLNSAAQLWVFIYFCPITRKEIISHFLWANNDLWKVCY